MKFFVKPFVHLYLVTTLFACKAQNQSSNNATETNFIKQTFTGASNQFAIESFFKFSENTNENILYSPYSLYSALLPVYLGTAGNTKTELGNALHINASSEKQIFEGYKTSVQYLNSLGNHIAKVNIANSLWLQTGYEVNKSYLKIYREYFDETPLYTDFINYPNQSVLDINNWVAHNTNDVIKDVVYPNDIHKLTRFVIANATFFEAEWMEKFDTDRTRLDTFYNAVGSKDTVMFMHMDHFFNYYGNEDIRLLELPYKGKAFSLVVILPAKSKKWIDFDVKEVLTKVTNNQYPVSQKSIDLALPKFKMEKGQDLIPLLKSMGIHDVFTSKCNLSGINSNDELLLYKVKQKTAVDISETKTQLVSSTVEFASVSSAFGQKNIPFIVNEPFIAILKNNRNSEILFTLRINQLN